MTISTIIILGFWILVSGFFIIMACILSSRIGQAEELIDYSSFKSGTIRSSAILPKAQSLATPSPAEAAGLTTSFGNR